jgi:hypothetical protein
MSRWLTVVPAPIAWMMNVAPPLTADVITGRGPSAGAKILSFFVTVTCSG